MKNKSKKEIEQEPEYADGVFLTNVANGDANIDWRSPLYGAEVFPKEDKQGRIIFLNKWNQKVKHSELVNRRLKVAD